MGKPNALRHLFLRLGILWVALFLMPASLVAQSYLDAQFKNLDSLFRAEKYRPELIQGAQDALKGTKKGSPERAILLYHIGVTHRRLANYQEAIECIKQSREIIDQNSTASAEIRYHIYQELTNLYEHFGIATTAMDNLLEEMELISNTIDILGNELKADTDKATRLRIADDIQLWAWRMSSCMMFFSTKFSIFAESTLKELPEFKKETKSIFGVNSLEYAQAEMLEGQLLEQTFAYEKAQQAYIRGVTRYVKLVGNRSPQYAEALYYWALLKSKLGDFDTARTSLQLVLRILDAKALKNHTYAAALEALALLNASEGALEEAAGQMQEAYDIQVVLFGENSPRAFHNQLQMTEVYMAQGNDRAAEAVFALLAKHFDKMYPLDISTSFQKEARLHINRNEFNEALQFLEGSQEIFDSAKGTFSENKEELLQHHHNLAYCYFRTNQYDKAETHYQQFLDINRQFAHDLFLFLSEQQRAAYWAHQSPILEQMLRINHTPENSHDTDFSHAMAKHWQARSSLLYDAALFQKGILLEASRNILAAIEQSDNAKLKQQLARQQTIYQQLARLASTPISSPQIAAQIRELKQESAQLERALMSGSRQYADFMTYLNITWRDIHRGLGDHDVAIEFITSTDGERTYYSAELLRKAFEQPLHVPLFNLPNGQPLNLDLRFVDHFLWPKLLPHLDPGDRIYFSPSGDLHKIAIEYLLVARGERASDRFQIHRLSSTRQLAMQTKPSENRSAVLYGGLDFNLGVEEMAYYAAVSPTRGTSVHANPKQLQTHTLWSYLPGTAQEVRQITPLLQQNNYTTTLYTGAEGIEESFKAQSGKRNRLMHIATHGFYLPEETPEEAAKAALRATFRTVHEEQSLLQSGLIFSGANHAWTAGASALPEAVEDGILTAKEIAALDLQGVDLVVLSACQTGLGAITGEGVFGLQRAFKKAGAQSLLMTLWEVDDTATQQMMTAFYRHLTSGKSKHEALAAAQKELQQKTFTTPDGATRSGTDPYYWAGFILLD